MMWQFVFLAGFFTGWFGRALGQILAAWFKEKRRKTMQGEE